MTESTNRDVLSLRGASFEELLHQFAAGATAEPMASTQRLTIIAQLVVGAAVRLIRGGGREDLANAGTALSEYLASASARAAERMAAGPHGDIVGLLPVLTVATSAASSGGSEMVLRSWGGRAEEVVQMLHAAPTHMLPRASLRNRLGVSESYLSHLLSDLEQAHLIERVGQPGRRSVEIHLGPLGRQLLESSDLHAVAPPRRQRQPARVHGMSDRSRRLERVNALRGPAGNFESERGTA